MPAESVKRRGGNAPATQPITTVITLVRRVGQLMVDELVDRLHSAGVEMPATFHPVFENLDPQGTRLTELAARAGMTHQSMGELVAALEQRGYLERRSDPADRRARLVCLTPKGRQFVRRAVREIRDIETFWQARFAAAGVEDFRAALEAAVSTADPTGASSNSR